MSTLLRYDFNNPGSNIAWQSFSPSEGIGSVSKLSGSDVIVQGSNTGFAQAAPDFIFSVYESSVSTTDGSIVVSHNLSNSIDMIQLAVRVQPDTSCYICRVELSQSILWYRNASGTYTQLGAMGTGYTYDGSGNQIITSMEITDTTIVVKVNGTTVITRTDNNILSSGKMQVQPRSASGYLLDYVIFSDTNISSPAVIVNFLF